MVQDPPSFWANPADQRKACRLGCSFRRVKIRFFRAPSNSICKFLDWADTMGAAMTTQSRDAFNRHNMTGLFLSDKLCNARSVKVGANNKPLPIKQTEELVEGTPRQVLREIKKVCEQC